MLQKSISLIDQYLHQQNKEDSFIENDGFDSQLFIFLCEAKLKLVQVTLFLQNISFNAFSDSFRVPFFQQAFQYFYKMDEVSFDILGMKSADSL